MIVWHVDTSSGARFDWAKDEEHLRQQLIEYNNETLNSGEPDEQLADDATLEEAIDLIEESESFSREDMHGVYALESVELNTILAALRFWQRKGNISGMPEWEIATNGSEEDPMSDEDIDALCESLNA